MKLPNLPADRKIAEQGGNLSQGFWTFFDSIIKAFRQAVYGGPSLTNQGAIPKVSEDGTLAESGVTDDGTTVYASARNVAVGATAAPNVAAGRNYVYVKGSSSLGVLEGATGQADGNAVGVMLIDAYDVNSTLAEKRIGYILFSLDGTTATKRGGRIYFATKADNGGLTIWGALTQAGKWGFGGNISPAEAIDATGDANVSGVYKVAGTQVVGAQQAAVAAPTGGGTAIVAPSGGAVIDIQARAAIAGIISAISSLGNTVDPAARTAINDIRARLAAHGLTA